MHSGCVPWEDYLKHSEALSQQISELLQRVGTLEATVANLEADQSAYQMPEECKDHRCTYYRHYLAYGPADLTHEGYHTAEKKCSEVQEKAMEWDKNHPDNWQNNPWNRQAEMWERKVRA